ncbi:hypothetical protein [Flavobacterium sp.]|uniref:hypothetical protein n=1 Tax=Flavobacterium sp. TaxID=239 RepID=UPI0025B95782|nr:hypothetical protein [Flavobacterium sp.]
MPLLVNWVLASADIRVHKGLRLNFPIQNFFRKRFHSVDFADAIVEIPQFGTTFGKCHPIKPKRDQDRSFSKSGNLATLRLSPVTLEEFAVDNLAATFR